MTEDSSAFSELLQHKRIGLVACVAIEVALADALRQAQVLFAHVDANGVRPGAQELERYHALILHVSHGAVESNWLRSELLQTNSRPLLLIGEPEAICGRESLHDQADDIIFTPFVPKELIFRLSRLVAGARDGRHAVVQPAKPCVVVADDDPDIINQLKKVFQDFDVDAHFVSDGRAALAAARRLLPDLLLLDIGMPVMNGLAVLRYLKTDPGTSALVTVLLTASADFSHVKNGADLGAVDYILKPFDRLGMIRKLKPLLPNQSSAVQ